MAAGQGLLPCVANSWQLRPPGRRLSQLPSLLVDVKEELFPSAAPIDTFPCKERGGVNLRALGLVKVSGNWVILC